MSEKSKRRSIGAFVFTQFIMAPTIVTYDSIGGNTLG